MNGRVVPVIRRKVNLYIEKEINIQRKPTGDEYLRWVDDLYEVRGQLGLLVEQTTIRGNGDWDADVEGMLTTK